MLLFQVYGFIVDVSCCAVHLFQDWSNSLCLSKCLHPFAGFCSLCQSVLLTLMGLDAFHDWNCQHLDKNKGRAVKDGVCVFKCVCVYIWGQTITCMQLYLGFMWFILAENKYPVASEKLCATAITLHPQN